MSPSVFCRFVRINVAGKANKWTNQCPRWRSCNPGLMTSLLQLLEVCAPVNVPNSDLMLQVKQFANYHEESVQFHSQIASTMAWIGKELPKHVEGTSTPSRSSGVKRKSRSPPDTHQKAPLGPDSAYQQLSNNALPLADTFNDYVLRFKVCTPSRRSPSPPLGIQSLSAGLRPSIAPSSTSYSPMERLWCSPWSSTGSGTRTSSSTA